MPKRTVPVAPLDPEDPYPAAPELVAGGSVEHPFAFDPLMALPAAAVGVVGRTTGVVVDAEELQIHFGPWSLTTPTANIAKAETSGPYAIRDVIGPPHLLLWDGAVRFATNRKVGLCISFHEPVPAIDPFHWLAHPAATVTVADPIALGRDLDRVRTG